jgi:DNA ligase (NAD+)
MEVLDIIKNIKKSNDMIHSIYQLKLNELEEIIKYSNDKYYNSDNPIISDSIYDILIDFLRVKNSKSVLLKKVGNGIKSKDKIKLEYWLGSMDKIKSFTHNLDNWIEKNNNNCESYNISDKLDGISALLVYNENKISMFTRGDGEYGMNISNLLKYINIPSYNTINNYIKNNTNIKGKKNLLAIRGELIMKEKIFENKWSDKFKNSRNLISGLVNSKKINPELALDTDLIVYELVDPFFEINNQFNILSELGFNIVYNKNINKEYLNYNKLSEYLLDRKNNNIYKIDGIIITNTNKNKRNIKGNPEYAFAYKDILEELTTKTIVNGIEWNISKDGYIIPTILVDAVNIGGVEIKRTAGFNAKYIVDNILGPGAEVEIIRSGDVIPHIVKVNKSAKSGKPLLPKFKWHWNDTNVDIILDNIENNIEYVIKNIYYFFSILKTKGLGQKNVEKIVISGLDTIPKILNASYDDLSKIDNFKDKTVNNILESIKYSITDITLSKLITASNKLGHGIGEEKIKQILIVYPNIIIIHNKWNYDEFIDNISKINGWDTKTSTQFVNNFPKFLKFYNSIKNIVKIKKSNDLNQKKLLLENKIFVFTGFRDISLEESIKTLGGKVNNTISKNTNYLVCKDIDEDSSKLQKAKLLNIKIINKNELIKLI